MATKAQEQSLEASCSDPAEERSAGSDPAAKHPDLDQGEPGTSGECSGAELSEMPAQPVSQRPPASLQVKQEEEPETEPPAVVPPSVATPAPTPAPAVVEGRGAKRMMEDDADGFKEMPDVCQEARASGRAMALPDLFGDAHQAHTSQGGGCAKVEQAVPCLSNMGSENQRKRFRGFAYKETEGPQVAYERLQELLFQWLKPEARSKEEIVEQLVLEQFLNLLPEEVQRWVRERHPENGDEAVALAEDYQFLHPEPGRRPYPERTRQRASARSWLR